MGALGVGFDVCVWLLLRPPVCAVVCSSVQVGTVHSLHFKTAAADAHTTDMRIQKRHIPKAQQPAVQRSELSTAMSTPSPLPAGSSSPKTHPQMLRRAPKFPPADPPAARFPAAARS